MFLSRTSLVERATESSAFWRAFGSEYDLHRTVWELFGDRPDRTRDFLYRIDSRHGKPIVWTLSHRRPEASPSLWRVETRELSPDLRPGDLLELEVRVNPVVCRERKRHDVVMDLKRRTGWRSKPARERETEAALVDKAVTEWMTARTDRLGVQVRRLRADGYRVRRFPKPSGKQLHLGVCDVTGLVEVIDPGRFLDAWKTGLGPAKGFGCGLLLIRRGRA